MLAFIDTSAIKAYYDRTDDFHRAATGFMQKIASRDAQITALVTTDHVLDEAITLTRFAHSHEKAVELAEASLASRFLSVVYTDEGARREALQTFKRHPDKEWSFTDCVSFTVMKKLEIAKAFTFDAHFRQAGFEIVP